MTTKMKFCLLLTSLLFFSLPKGIAQDYLTIKKKNGELIQVLLSDISKLTFNSGAIDSLTNTDSTLQIVKELQMILKLKSYPNPATDFLNIDYELTEHGSLTIEIFKLSGGLVNEILIRDQGIGKHTYQCDLRNLQSGVYIFKIRQNNKFLIEQIIKTN
ncbi:MAG: T9SS type A sorting domain-containing protein [Bacteroidales bacterium]|nr:T9SS type A sorting domain-containing protein [Bacteroidales bacterium]